jgi:flagellar biosynthetic protein FliQ
MTPESVIGLGQQAMEMTLLLAGPILLVVLIIGLLIGMFQAVTQINEMTLSFVPKLIAVGLTLLVAGAWMLNVFTGYARSLIESIPALIG